MDEHVLRGNTGILKCHIPSFVADYVFVSSWIEDEVNEIYTESEQHFAQGNIGILTSALLDTIRSLLILINNSILFISHYFSGNMSFID